MSAPSQPARTHRGVDAIAAMFTQARAEGRAAFLPYYPVGYPTFDATLDAIQAMAEAGVDGFEIGMPFSDPLADGPTIQAATQVALANGVTVARCIEAVAALRTRGVVQPMLLMGYLNPVLAYGVERFITDARAAGADGVVVPDLPPDEMTGVGDALADAGLAHVQFLAPTSSAARIALAAERATGFIYVVSVTGVTGARRALPPDLADFIGRVRQQAQQPLVLGFGISQPEQARAMNDLVEGFIVGSALVRAGGESTAAVAALAGTLRRALDA